MDLPACPLTRYVEQRVERLGRLGGSLQEIDVHEFGDSATIHAFVEFEGDEPGLLTAFEFVRIEDEGPVTRRYSYHCTRGDGFLFRFDHDPIGHPDMPDHKHVPGSDRPLPSRRMGLRDVAGELLAQVAPN